MIDEIEPADIAYTTADGEVVLWETVSPTLDWWVLSARCTRCSRIAGRFYAPRGHSDAISIITHGQWTVAQGEDRETPGWVRNPCLCRPAPTLPPAGDCRAQISRAVNNGLGDDVDHRSVTVMV